MKARYLLLSLVIFLSANYCNASSDNAERLKEGIKKYQTETYKIRNNIFQARKELCDIYSTYDYDSYRVNILIEKISSLQKDLLDLHLQHQLLMRKYLDSEKFYKLHRAIKNSKGAALKSNVEDDLLPEFTKNFNKENYRRHRNNSQSDIMPVVNNLRNNTKKLIDLFSKYDLDITQAKKTIDYLHAGQKKLLEIINNKQVEIRKNLTKEEFEKLKIRHNKKHKLQKGQRCSL